MKNTIQDIRERQMLRRKAMDSRKLVIFRKDGLPVVVSEDGGPGSGNFGHGGLLERLAVHLAEKALKAHLLPAVKHQKPRLTTMRYQKRISRRTTQMLAKQLENALRMHLSARNSPQTETPTPKQETIHSSIQSLRFRIKSFLPIRTWL